MSDAAASVDGPPNLLELTNVTKTFGSTRALNDVSLTVRSGEVVGLIGDNGAGKSTIVKIITGYFTPTTGTVSFDGEPINLSTAMARGLGIEAVYQDLALIEELSLWRNFFLGKELRSGSTRMPLTTLRKKEMKDLTLRNLDELGLTRIRSANEPAALLSGGEKQSLAITRAVHFGARLLILDEPTAALSVRETLNVLDTIRRSADRGLGVLYIDHNMSHVQPVADRIVVLEHGRVASEHKGSDVTVEDLASMLSKVRGEHDPRKAS
ncbi:MAG: ATP-binding cassette domain-containing protein [Acidimicrobiia bacterium]